MFFFACNFCQVGFIISIFSLGECVVFNFSENSTTLPDPLIPQYIFRYYVRDGSAADYKTSQQINTNVSKSITMFNSFKPNVIKRFRPSPIPPTPSVPKNETFSYNDQRTGISLTSKQRRKSTTVRRSSFSPIIVKSFTEFPHTASSPFDPQSTYVASPKPVTMREKKLSESMSPLYRNHSVVGVDNFTLTRTTSENPNPPITASPNGLRQLESMDIPSSVIEILDQRKYDFEKFTPTPVPAHKTFIEDVNKTRSREELNWLKRDLLRSKSVPLPSLSSEGGVQNFIEKFNLSQQRPMKLIGLTPFYSDHDSPDESAFMSQGYVKSVSDAQYSRRAPFYFGSSLLAPPTTLFRDVFRSVSDTSDSNAVTAAAAVTEGVPTLVPQANDVEVPMATLCADCVLPLNYIPYPISKMPISETTNQRECPPGISPAWASQKATFAYILLPSQLIKNNS